MDNRLFIEILKTEKERNLQQIEKLRDINESIDILLQRYPVNGFSNQIKPGTFIKNLFKQNPEKKWTIDKILKELKILKSSNLLKSKSKNLRFTVHNCIRILFQSNYINRIGNYHSAFYTLNIDKNEENIEE